MFFQFILCVVLGLNLLLGIIVLAKNPKKHINISFFLFVISLILWILTNYLSNNLTDYITAFFVNKLIFLFTPYIVFSLLYFSIVFPNDSYEINYKKLLLLLIPVLISNILTLTDLTISGITFLKEGGTGVIFKNGIIFWAIQFLSYLFLSVYILAKKYNKEKGYYKVQLQYIVYGVSVTTFLATITNFIIPLLINNYWLSNFGPFFTLIFISATTYAIIRHRLMDIRSVIARSVAYSLVVLILIVFYATDVFLISRNFFSNNVTIIQALTYSVLAIFIAYTYQPLKHYLEVTTDHIFYKGKYDSNNFIFTLTKLISSTINLESLTKNTLLELINTMRITKGSYIIFNENSQNLVISEGYKKEQNFGKHVLDKLYTRKRIIIFEDETNEEIKQIMRSMEASIILPLFEEENKEGLLILGEKKSGEIYSEQDIDVLQIFGPEVSVAIQNAKSYEEISRFNITLKEEVEKATKDLKEANLRLQELDKLKDEFVSLASHELRTPMTAIKSYLWMVLSGHGGALNEKQRFYTERAYSSVDRLIKLVNDMLNISRIESGRLTLDMQSVDIRKTIQEVIEEVSPRADELGVKIIMDKGENIPEVIADSEKIKEVLFNLIGNSLKFTPKDGSIHITINKQEKDVAIQIQDTGAGIASEDLPKLFNKFGLLPGSYTTNQPVMGTGLGLYICRSIIQLHQGTIKAVSEGKGKGSTFTFTLKISSDDELSKLPQKNNNKTEKVQLIHTHI